MLLGDLTSSLQFLFVANGLITFALLAGAAAVYLLLPRPQPYPWPWGVVSTVLSLGLLGWHLVRPGSLEPEPILFYAFSALAILGGGLLITQRNPARAALAFTLVVLSTCGLYLLLAAPFLMAATIIIYAGAIVVTFLFVLMLAQQEGPSNADQRSREPLLATIAGFVFLGVFLFLLDENFSTRNLEPFLVKIQAAKAKENADEMSQALGDGLDEMAFFRNLKEAIQAGGRSQGFHELAGTVDNLQFKWFAARQEHDVHKMRSVLVDLEKTGLQAVAMFGQLQPPAYARLSNLSGPPSNLPPDSYRRENGVPVMPAENTAYLGRSLFTDYLLPVELGGTLLLVATIGAIAIAYRRPGRAP